MKCSVYAAQYLLDALFDHGRGRRALELMLADGDRSWKHMVDSGTTMTWEAWDLKYKPNQDWNHAWGAAPANLLPRCVLGVQPVLPGWTTVRIQPYPWDLKHARGQVPSPHGPIKVRWSNGATFQVSVKLPDSVDARVVLPSVPGASGVWNNGHPIDARLDGDHWVVSTAVRGTVELEVK